MAVINPAGTRIGFVNKGMGLGFFSTVKDLLYPKISRIVPGGVSTREVEPFNILGAAPFAQVFNGNMSFPNVNEFNYSAVNKLFKAGETLRRRAIELDQTGYLLQRGNWLGQRLAQWPEMTMIRKLLIGYLASSAYETDDAGIPYRTTLDGKPFFSTTHDWYAGQAQSNVIVGNQPSTFAAYANQDPGTLRNNFQKDLVQITAAFGTFKDDKGVPLFPNFNAEENLVIVTGQRLKSGARDSFTKIASGQPTLANLTSVTSPAFVRDVYASGFLDSCPDTYASSPGATISPEYETEYYALYMGHTTAPLYWQPFQTLSEDRQIGGEGIDAEIAKLMNKVPGATLLSATQFASTALESNFGSVGNNADELVMNKELFEVTIRANGCAVYGHPATAIKIIPSGGNPSSSNG